MTAPNTLTAALDQIREREHAATKGLWVADVIPSLRDRPVILLSDPDDDAADLLFRADSPQATEADAEFIAHARQDVPLLLAAIEAVLKLHQPHPVKWTNPCGKHWDFAGDYSACTDCEHIAYIACTRCRNTEDEPARFGHCEVRETVRAALTGEKPGR